MMPTSNEDYDKIQAKKKELAKKLSGKSEILEKVAKQYSPNEEEAEMSLARQVFDEALEEYQEGEFSWEEFIEELSKSLKAIK